MDREHGGWYPGEVFAQFCRVEAIITYFGYFAQKLRRVILEDELGICNELEAFMDNLIHTYEDEWAGVVKG